MTQGRNALIGLTGRKGAGKDAMASVLIEMGFENVKFAGALKSMVEALLRYQGVDEDTIGRMIEGDLKEVESDYLAGRTPRYVMQTIGTEWGRDLVGTDLWVNCALNRAATLPQAVITDVRFPNECDAVQQRGGSVFLISACAGGVSTDAHESEAHIDNLPVDAVFFNDHSLGIFRAQTSFELFLKEEGVAIA